MCGGPVRPPDTKHTKSPSPHPSHRPGSQLKEMYWSPSTTQTSPHRHAMAFFVISPVAHRPNDGCPALKAVWGGWPPRRQREILAGILVAPAHPQSNLTQAAGDITHRGTHGNRGGPHPPIFPRLLAVLCPSTTAWAH